MRGYWRYARLSWTRSLAWFGMLSLVGLAYVAQADPGTDRQFLWQEANAALAHAQQPEAFAHAADRYEQLIQRGARNGPLFYNYGLALLNAGKPDLAARALLRAERYAGTNPE
ncbi:MAG: hypothetical protein O3A51_13365, partial [Verrucomicrobia bacterium]|nr:hypothetical protein [Verrucomicrobiota bacterium]